MGNKANEVIYTAGEFARDVKILAETIRSAKCCYMDIYGVPRGGTCLAVALSMELGIPLTDRVDKYTLVVDDLVDSGRTRQQFSNNDFAVLHAKRWGDVATYAVHRGSTQWIVYWWEGGSANSIVDVVTRQLQYIGENPNREGLKETPERVVRSWGELYGGYKEDNPENLLKVFEQDSSDEMVLLRNIEFYSTCEHHLLPFFGRAHIAYIPNGKVVGISKLARLLEVFARRLQIQERLCQQVTKAINNALNPLGSACILEAQHLCMTGRGVKKQHSTMVTSSLTGVFRSQVETRQELLSMIGGGK